MFPLRPRVPNVASRRGRGLRVSAVLLEVCALWAAGCGAGSGHGGTAAGGPGGGATGGATGVGTGKAGSRPARRHRRRRPDGNRRHGSGRALRGGRRERAPAPGQLLPAVQRLPQRLRRLGATRLVPNLFTYAASADGHGDGLPRRRCARRKAGRSCRRSRRSRSPTPTCRRSTNYFKAGVSSGADDLPRRERHVEREPRRLLGHGAVVRAALHARRRRRRCPSPTSTRRRSTSSSAARAACASVTRWRTRSRSITTTTSRTGPSRTSSTTASRRAARRSP